MAEEHEGISESRVTFYRVQGHSHDGENSSKIDLSQYDLSDIIDMSQFDAAVLSSVENAVIRPKGVIVGIGDAVLDIDGSDPDPPAGLTVTSTADADSPGNILINVSWNVDADGANNTYVVELWKSTNGISGNYIISRSAETSGNSHVFEWADNRSGDVGSVYYKVRVLSVSPVGIRSLAAEATVAPASDSSIPGAITFNDDFQNFDEGLKTTFKGFFVKLDDSSEFDVKLGRGAYEWQVSVNNTASNFATAANLKASGRSKGTYIVVNTLEVRASAGASKTNYYLRVRAIDSSNNAGPWVYYRSTAGGGSNGAGSSTAGNASAINVLEITGTVDIQGGSITADEIQAGTITADEIAANAIEAVKIKAGEITADKFVSLLSFSAGGDMQSSDFSNVSGSEAGWKIEGGQSGGDSGTAIFQSVTVRGVINADSGYLGGTDGWTIGTDGIQSGTGSSAVRISTGGSSDPAFIRLGAKSGYDAANTGIWMDPTNGLVVGSGAGNFSADITGSITASAGLIGGWSIGANKLHSGTDIELLKTEQTIAIGSGKAVMKRFTSGSGSGDLKIGIDASGGYDPIYGQAGDMVMWWDDSASAAKFSLSDKLTFDGTNLTINDGAITAPTIQTSTSGSRLVLSPLNALPDVQVDYGTLQAGTGGSGPFTEVTLKSGSSAYDDYYNDLILITTGGTGSGQTRIISNYVGSTKVATVSVAFDPDPDNTTTYTLTRETNTFLRGYTGKSTEDYPGFIYYYDERDLVTHSRRWGRVAFSAPRYTSTLAYSGFNFSHSDDGWGELTFGLPSNADQFVIADEGSGSTQDDVPTNTFNRGGITIIGGANEAAAVRRTANTLYNVNGTLHWNGSAVGGSSSGVDSIIAGDLIDVSSGTGDVTIAVDLSELNDGTAAIVGTQDELVYLDNGTQKRKMINEITLSDFNNDEGWTSNTGDVDSIVAGDLIDISSGTGNVTVAVDLSELNDGTAAIVGSQDELVYLDNGAQKRKMINEISLSAFSNDAGWTSNAGDITSVSAGGNGLTGGGTFGALTLYHADTSSQSSSNNSGNTFIQDITLDSYGHVTGLQTNTASASISFPLEAPAGTVGAPSYSFGDNNGDTHTGMYATDNDEIAFATGGSLRFLISGNGISQIRNILPQGSNAYDIGYSAALFKFRDGFFDNELYCDHVTESSDVSLKTDISDGTLGLDFVKGLRPVSYKWIETGGRSGVRTHQGFIAQEVETLLGSDAAGTSIWINAHQPALLAEESPSGEAVEESYTQMLRYTEFIPVLTKAIQELEARLAALEA